MSVIGSNLERVKNIFTGKYTDKTTSSVGYKRSSKRHKEGDTWEEDGKTWTIKNGLKQNVTKLDSARKALLVPFKCPSCDTRLTNDLHKHFFKTQGKCYNCIAEEETKMRAEGTFDTYSKQLYKNNALAWLEEKRVQFEEFIQNPETLRGFVTERGDVEDWYGGHDIDKLKEQFEKEYNEIKSIIDNI